MPLHGHPGTPRTRIDLGDLPAQLTRPVGQGKAHPFIVVIPEICPGGVNTDCGNTPDRSTADRLARDVPDLVSRTFRTLPAPGSRSLLGVSTGGFCAA